MAIALYVPENLDLAVVLPPDLKEYADHAKYLIHLVVRQTVLGEADAEGFVPLKVAYLRKIIPDRVERKLRWALVRAKVLECDAHYIQGAKAMGYRLAPKYRMAAVRKVECANWAVAAKICKHLHRDRAAYQLDVHRHLWEWYGKLKIEIEQARKIAKALDHPEVHLAAVEMIAGRHMEFSSCAMGRVHTIVTRLKRELRPALRIHDQPLCGIDVCNSQPLILALLIHAYRSSGNGFNLRSDSTPYINLPILTNTHRNGGGGWEGGCGGWVVEIVGGWVADGFANRVRICEDGRLAPDERQYVALCERGEFYEFMQHSTGSALPRSEFKAKCFAEVFYGQTRHVTRLTRAFGARFPNVAAIIREAKQEDHGNLARVMQRFESSLIINGVCRRLMCSHPQVPVLTIHDSLLTTPENVGVIKGAMAEEFQRVGLGPMLKVEHYGVDQAQVQAAA